MIRNIVSAFLRPRNIFNIPAGQQGVDPTGANGLIGFMQNANTYSNSLQSTAASGTAMTLTGAQIAAGIANITSGATGNFTVTLPLTSQIFAALGNTIPLDGSFSKMVFFCNNGSPQIGTLTAGDANQAISGSAILGSNMTRCYVMRVLNSSNISFTNIGQLAIV